MQWSAPLPLGAQYHSCAPGRDVGPTRLEGRDGAGDLRGEAPAEGDNFELCQFSKMVIWNRSAKRALLLNVDYYILITFLPVSPPFSIPCCSWWLDREGLELKLQMLVCLLHLNQ